MSITQEHLMAGWLLLGIALGLLFAYLANRRKSRFREILISDFDHHQRQGTSIEHFSQLTRNRGRWIQSLSVVRKPFSPTVNLAIETAALIYASVALVNAFVHTSKIFTSPVQTSTVLVLIGAVIAFIPSERLFSGRIEKQMSLVLDDITRAIQKNELEAYFSLAKRSQP